MKEITFRYADAMSNWQWRTQRCVVESVEECIRIYDLGVDCEYEILEVKYEYNGVKVAEIHTRVHSELMKYWTDNKKDVQLPIDNVFCYLCWIEKDKVWDAICVMETKDGLYLFGESFIHKENALKWVVGDYEDTDELIIKDKAELN